MNTISNLVKLALEEDIQDGDITAQLIPENKNATAIIIVKEKAIICGQEYVNETLKQVDSTLDITWHCQDGDVIKPMSQVLTVIGNAKSILTAERTALNFLQMLSGTATLTARYLAKLKGTKTKLLDTRKTIPAFRMAQKYAVKCAGGTNHRFGLYDAYLIKENHIAACGSIKNAIDQAKTLNPNKTIEVEVRNLNELQQAIDAEANIIMLDNFSLDDIKKAVKLNTGTAKLEASGNVDLKTIYPLATTGVDYISVGALTKTVMPIDFSMLIL